MEVCKVESICILIKDQKITLTVEEARELQKSLNDLLGQAGSNLSTLLGPIARNPWDIKYGSEPNTFRWDPQGSSSLGTVTATSGYASTHVNGLEPINQMDMFNMENK